MKASLNGKLQNVKWGEYKLEDLFTSSNGDVDIQKRHINGYGDLVITAGLVNNGVLGKTDIPAKLFDSGTITVDMFGYAFYRAFKYKMVTHARVFSIKPKFTITKRQGIFLSNALHFLHKKYGFENMCSWEKIKTENILLPTKKEHIDFEFMENFIAEIEASYIAKLNAYFVDAGFKNYVLSEEEKSALNDLKIVQWKEYKINRFFVYQPIKHKLSKKELSDNFKYPAYSSATVNGSMVGYANSAEFICDKNVPLYVTFGDHTRVFNIVKMSFSVLDNVKVLKPRIFNENILMFIIAAWTKQIPNCGYARHWKIAKQCCVPLPTRNGQVDFDFMEKYISAIQKLIIKKVALFIEKNY